MEGNMWSYLTGAKVASEPGEESGPEGKEVALDEEPVPFEEEPTTAEIAETPVEESTPLLGEKEVLASSSSSSSSVSWLTWFLCLLVFVLVVALTFLLPTNFVFHAWYNDVHSPSQADVMYRPACQVFTDQKVQVIQTSLAQPDQQWAPMHCQIDANPWFSGGSHPPIEKYGAPDAKLMVDLSEVAHPTRQPIMGFGGAFTEASARNYESLSQQGKDAVMELLFGKSGLGYR